MFVDMYLFLLSYIYLNVKEVRYGALVTSDVKHSKNKQLQKWC